MIRVFCRVGFAIFIALFVSGIARADVAILSSTSDTFIVSSNPNNNAGSHSHAAAGRDAVGGVRRALYQFDLGGIPADSVITSATFSANVVIVPIGPANSTFNLFALNAGWVEGAKVGNSGSAATSGESTWNARRHTVESWTTAGGDFAPGVLASTFVSGGGSYQWSSGSLITAAQNWLDNPSTNFGILLASASEAVSKTARGFSSREGDNAATLTIGYDPPPPPLLSAISSIEIPENKILSLAWTNNPGMKYDVLFTHSLTEPQTWELAEANIHTNTWSDPPYLTGPLYPSNTPLFYALNELPATPTAMTLRLDVVVSNLTAPTAIANAGDGSGRLFIAEQLGQIRVVTAGFNLLSEPFLDISAKMTNLAPPFGVTPGINPAYDERGLLGLAFHPDYGSNGRFFVFYSSPKTGPGIHCESILSEFSVSATNVNMADPTSEQILLRFDKPEFNHNGGDITFGPDGYLYIPSGDGGGADDAHPPFGNGQNLSNLLGKILRIDVDSGSPYSIPPDNPFVSMLGAQPEIYAFGLRNPWKVAFDSTNLWVADVGQNIWEEINLVKKGGNYGWRILEGKHAFDIPLADAIGVSIPQLEFPIHEYPHGPLGISIIGGFVYRGAGYPELQGRYIFGDFSTSFGLPDGSLYYLEETRPGIWERFEFVLSTGTNLQRFVKSFGQGEDGELYLSSSVNLGPSGTTADIRILLPP